MCLCYLMVFASIICKSLVIFDTASDPIPWRCHTVSRRAHFETSSQSLLLFCPLRLQISTFGHVYFCCSAGALSDRRLIPEWTDELCYYGLTWIFFDDYLASLFPVFCQPDRLPELCKCSSQFTSFHQFLYLIIYRFTVFYAIKSAELYFVAFFLSF